jgi:hypothetical protein
MRELRVAPTHARDQPAILRAPILLFAQRAQELVVHRQHLAAGLVARDAPRQVARQGPGRAVDQGLHPLDAERSDEPLRVRVPGGQGGEDGGAARRQRPACPPDVQAGGRRLLAGVSLPLRLRPHLVTREAVLDEALVVQRRGSVEVSSARLGSRRFRSVVDDVIVPCSGGGL